MNRAGLLALLISVAACGGSEKHVGAPSVAPSELKAPGEARVGDRTRCPVSGEEFVVTETSPKTEYEGKTYYFCCPGCDGKFKADPKKYLNKPD